MEDVTGRRGSVGDTKGQPVSTTAALKINHGLSRFLSDLLCGCHPAAVVLNGPLIYTFIVSGRADGSKCFLMYFLLVFAVCGIYDRVSPYWWHRAAWAGLLSGGPALQLQPDEPIFCEEGEIGKGAKQTRTPAGAGALDLKLLRLLN
jgi:hypothetical protein